MKITYSLSAALVTMAFSGSLAVAQDVVPAAAPQVAATPADLTGEPATIDHVVYLARLPAPADLVKAAAAQGIKIMRMDQTSDRIVVVYQYSGGRTVTFAYTSLAAAGATTPALAVTPSTQIAVTPVTTTTAVQPAVVYTTEPQTVYYYEPAYTRYYDPVWDFWAPLALGVGLGWNWHSGGHGGGDWHGGGMHGGGPGHH